MIVLYGSTLNAGQGSLTLLGVANGLPQCGVLFGELATLVAHCSVTTANVRRIAMPHTLPAGFSYMPR